MAESKRRDKDRQAYWKRMIERQGHSGVSIRAFCRGHKLTETAFYFWRGELARRRDEAEMAHFVPVRLAAQEPSAEQASPENARQRRTNEAARSRSSIPADIAFV